MAAVSMTSTTKSPARILGRLPGGDKTLYGNIPVDTTPGEDEQDPSRNSKAATLRPLLFSMRLFGIYPVYGQCSRYCKIIVAVFSGLLVLGYWGNVARYFLMYEENRFGPYLLLKIISHADSLGAAVAGSIYLWKSRDIAAFLEEWATMKKSDKKMSSRLRRNAWVCTFAGFFCVLLPLPGAWPLEHNKIMLSIMATPIGIKHNTTEEKITTFAAIAIPYIFLVGCWTFAVFFLFVCCLGLADDFRCITEELRQAVAVNQRPEPSFLNCMESFRRKHVELCSLVMKFDNIFSAYVLTVYLIDVPVICFSVYIMISTPAILSAGSIQAIVRIILMCMSLLLVTGGGTVLNSAAQDPKTILYGLDLRNAIMTTELSAQLNLFLMKLMEAHFGISAWKLFFINKRTIKMVFLMIVSYVVILLRFGNQEENEQAVFQSIFDRKHHHNTTNMTL